MNILKNKKFKNIWLDWRSTILGVASGVVIMLGEALTSPEGLTYKGVLGGVLIAMGGGLSDLRNEESKIIKPENDGE
jgi:hypothetical protein